MSFLDGILLVIGVAIARSRAARTPQFVTVSCREPSSTDGASGKIASRKRCREAATRIIAAILLGSALRESYMALRFAQAMQARTPRRPDIRQDRSHSLFIRVSTDIEGSGTMSTGAALSFLAWWQEMAARTECSVDGDAASRVCRQALGRRDWPATGSRNQIRHAHRIC